MGASIFHRMVARSKEEYRKSVDWHRRMADDVAYRKELRRLEDIGEALWTIMHTLQEEVDKPIDTSKLGVPPPLKMPLPHPPPRK